MWKNYVNPVVYGCTFRTNAREEGWSLRKIAVFDMDGVLVDSEIVYFRSISEVVDSFGGRLTKMLFRKVMGIPMEKGGAEKVIELTGINATREEFLKRIRKSYHKYFSTFVEPRPGIKELLEKLKDMGVKICVATSTFKDAALERLKRIDVLKYLDKAVFGNEVKKSKPDPEIFLLLLKKVGGSPKEVVVFEDSVNGVKSAKAAGLDVYGVLHEFNSREDLMMVGALDVFELPKDVEKMLRLFQGL